MINNLKTLKTSSPHFDVNMMWLLMIFTLTHSIGVKIMNKQVSYIHIHTWMIILNRYSNKTYIIIIRKSLLEAVDSNFDTHWRNGWSWRARMRRDCCSEWCNTKCWKLQQMRFLLLVVCCTRRTRSNTTRSCILTLCIVLHWSSCDAK